MLLVFSGKVAFSLVTFWTATGESLDCGNSWKTETVHEFYSRTFKGCPQCAREGGVVGGGFKMDCPCTAFPELIVKILY